MMVSYSTFLIQNILLVSHKPDSQKRKTHCTKTQLAFFIGTILRDHKQAINAQAVPEAI